MKLKLTTITIVSCLTAVNFPAPAQAGDTQLNVLSVNSSPHGKTYAEWSAKWWQWFLSIPQATNPSSGGPCEAGQSDKVWFLAGLFNPSTTPVECTVPLGTMLFFPIANVECSNAEPPPFFGEDEQAQQTCATEFLDSVEDDLALTLTLDGKTLPNPKAYRVASGGFDFRAPEGAVFGISKGTWSAAADGYYVMIPPLAPGPHTLRFTGIGGVFNIDTTYAIFVSNR